eukprot:TRINITY_DN6978_c0_g2_i9.p2 TRINITY_DN6978_c0_g2~~TRINITY_DN6978_c0_g2_i9.p2  ORF type:complete len:124 (-),score=30.34 TRINITY_DN6978_c0_g2_i9:150-521(-)
MDKDQKVREAAWSFLHQGCSPGEILNYKNIDMVMCLGLQDKSNQIKKKCSEFFLQMLQVTSTTPGDEKNLTGNRGTKPWEILAKLDFCQNFEIFKDFLEKNIEEICVEVKKDDWLYISEHLDA